MSASGSGLVTQLGRLVASGSLAWTLVGHGVQLLCVLTTGPLGGSGRTPGGRSIRGRSSNRSSPRARPCYVSVTILKDGCKTSATRAPRGPLVATRPRSHSPRVTDSSTTAPGLRHSTDRDPGIRRRRSGRGFSYRARNGRPIRDPETLERIRKLAIPPAWTDVWICPVPTGHLQATGRDARGRKQYRYHARYRRRRDAAKYERLLAFAKVLPAIRRRVDRDLARTKMSREKVLAAVVRLLELTLIRVGNDEYARLNRSFGLTTLRNRHATVRGSSVRFRFRGKSGQQHEVSLRDRRLAAVVRRCRDLPGQELFQYVDEDGEVD